jgi:hypothetical protein
MPQFYKILDNGVSPMASKKSGNPKGYNKTGGKKNDPNRAKFVEKYLKQNTKSADRPATKKQARNAYYLTSVDDKKGARGERKMARTSKTTAGSMMQTRADGKKPGSPTRNPAGSMKEKRVAGPSKTKVASKSQAIRSADKASDAKRRKSGVTRARGMY